LGQVVIDVGLDAFEQSGIGAALVDVLQLHHAAIGERQTPTRQEIGRVAMSGHGSIRKLLGIGSRSALSAPEAAPGSRARWLRSCAYGHAFRTETGPAQATELREILGACVGCR
jgi:hypothetical protein